MTLAAGSRLGPYETVSPIGAGVAHCALHDVGHESRRRPSVSVHHDITMVLWG